MKSFLLVLSFFVLFTGGYQLFTYWQLDEDALRAQVIPSAPVRFVNRTHDELAALRERLAAFDALDPDLLDPSDASTGGRKRLFLPDKGPKTLGLSL